MTLPPLKKKKKNSTIVRDRIIIALVVLGAMSIIVLVAAGIMFGAVAYDGFLTEGTYNYTDEQAQVAIESALITTLPDTASNPYYFYTAFQDYYFRIRFELPPEDVSAFLDSIDHMCFEQPLIADLMPFYRTDTGHYWWQPFSAERYIGAEQCGDNPYWTMIVDQSNPTMSIVYIESFST